MNVHLIAVGGSAMHNMAIALHEKGFKVTGSDDQIFEPSLSRLKKHGLLPEKEGWDTANIHANSSASKSSKNLQLVSLSRRRIQQP